MEEDQGRIGNALATYHHPLLDPAEPKGVDLGDAARKALTVGSVKRRRLSQMSHVFRSAFVTLHRPGHDAAMTA